MKKVIIGLLLTLLAGVCAAGTYPLFSPVTGVLKGSASTYVTSAATSADIYGLWSSCTSVKFLRGDGACAAVTLSTDVTGTLAVANGGTGIASYTAGDLIYASGSTALSKLAAGASTQYLAGGASLPVWTTLNTGETDATYVGTATWDGVAPSGATTHRYSWQKQGAMVSFNIRLQYATAGTTNTSVSLTFPAGMPTPVYLTGTAASDVVNMVSGEIAASTTLPSLTRQGFIRRNAAGTGFELFAGLNSSSISATTAAFAGIYFTTP